MSLSSEELRQRVEDLAASYECDIESSVIHRRACPGCTTADRIRSLVKEDDV